MRMERGNKKLKARFAVQREEDCQKKAASNHRPDEEEKWVRPDCRDCAQVRVTVAQRTVSAEGNKSCAASSGDEIKVKRQSLKGLERRRKDRRQSSKKVGKRERQTRRENLPK